MTIEDGWQQADCVQHTGEHGGASGDPGRLPGHAAGHVWHLRAPAGNRAAAQVQHRIGRFSDARKGKEIRPERLSY